MLLSVLITCTVLSVLLVACVLYRHLHHLKLSSSGSYVFHLHSLTRPETCSDSLRNGHLENGLVCDCSNREPASDHFQPSSHTPLLETDTPLQAESHFHSGAVTLRSALSVRADEHLPSTTAQSQSLAALRKSQQPLFPAPVASRFKVEYYA